MTEVPEWTPEQAISAIAKVLKESIFGQETDMTDEEATTLADAISARMEKGPIDV